MGKENFVAQELAKRGIGPDWMLSEEPTMCASCAEDTSEVLELTEESLFEEEFLSDAAQESGKKSPEYKAKEAAFYEKYEAYIRPKTPLSSYREECLLADLVTLLREINEDWAKNKAARYRSAGLRADVDIPLQEACIGFYNKLLEDKAAGKYVAHALSHYITISRRKAIDNYYRPEFGRYVPNSSKVQPTKRESNVELYEDYNVDSDGTYHDDRNLALSCDPFSCMQRPVWEREDLSRQLAVIYLHKLMDYSGEPQKPLAVMYGSCLYQLAKVSGSEDSLSQKAAKSTTLTSKEWAHEKMGRSTLRLLGDESESIVSDYYDGKLSWGRSFVAYMKELSPDGHGLKWADIVYTQTYTKEQTSDWIESISKSSIIQAARAIAENKKLVEYVTETLGKKNKFRKALEKLVKEGEK